jgi:hypothetical protein
VDLPFGVLGILVELIHTDRHHPSGGSSNRGVAITRAQVRLRSTRATRTSLLFAYTHVNVLTAFRHQVVQIVGFLPSPLDWSGPIRLRAAITAHATPG